MFNPTNKCGHIEGVQLLCQPRSGMLHSFQCSVLQAVHTSLSRNQPQSMSRYQPQSLSHNSPSHCPSTSPSHCPATSHSNCPISLLDAVLAQQPYCSCPPHGQCALFRNWALSPGVVLNLKVGCTIRRLRKFWKCTVICRFLKHTCTLYMYDASTLYCYCHAPRVTKPPLWHDWPRYAYHMVMSACSDMAYAVHKCNLIAFLLTFWSIVCHVCLEFFWWACLWGYCFRFVASCKHCYCACIHTL